MKKSLLMIAVVLALAACSERAPAPAPVVTPVAAAASGAPQVIVIQQPAAQQSNGVGTALAAGAIGFMAGNALSNSSRAVAPAPVAPTIVNRTVIVKQYAAPAPVVAPKPALTSVAAPAPKLSLSKTFTPSKSSFGGFRRR